MARPTRPAIGAVTRVNSRFSSAALQRGGDRVDLRRRFLRERGAAVAAPRATWRPARRAARRAAPPSWRAGRSLWPARAPPSGDRPRPGTAAGRSGTAGRRGFTIAPSRKRTPATKPETLGRTATVFTASSRPVNSSHSVTSLDEDRCHRDLRRGRLAGLRSGPRAAGSRHEEGKQQEEHKWNDERVDRVKLALPDVPGWRVACV